VSDFIEIKKIFAKSHVFNKQSLLFIFYYFSLLFPKVTEEICRVPLELFFL